MGAINGASSGKKGLRQKSKPVGMKEGKGKGVKGKPVRPGSKKEKNCPGILTILVCVLLMVATGLGVGAYAKFIMIPNAYNQGVSDTAIGQTQVLVASEDIQSGDMVESVIKKTNVPSTIVPSNALAVGSDVSELRASTPIAANSIITVNNTYEPAKQDVTLNGSRLISIGYIDTNNVDVGDYVDIRIKRYTDESTNSYSDDIVCSKKLVIDKKANGNMVLSLTEADILNLNTAAVETALKKTSKDGIKQTCELYLATYVDPANQTKAQVTYSGKGITYTSAELAEAQQMLRNMNTGSGDVYAQPSVETETAN